MHSDIFMRSPTYTRPTTGVRALPYRAILPQKMIPCIGYRMNQTRVKTVSGKKCREIRQPSGGAALNSYRRAAARLGGELTAGGVDIPPLALAQDGGDVFIP